MNAFEAALQRGEIDLNIYGAPHEDICWLVAYVMLPENDEAYSQFRRFLFTGDGLSNKAGRKNNDQTVYWLKTMSADDLLPRLEHITAQYPGAMLGRLDYVVDQMRSYASWLMMMRRPLPPRIEHPRTVDDDFYDYYRAQQQQMQDAADQDNDVGTIA